MHYTGNSTPITLGCGSGTQIDIIIEPGEFITSVNGFFHNTKLCQLSFTNNKGIVHPPLLYRILNSPVLLS